MSMNEIPAAAAKQCKSLNDIRNGLFSMADADYRNFHKKLIPTVPEDRIIGIRTPLLRKYAKQLHGLPCAESFIECLPHEYYDENNLHSFLLEQEKDFGRLIDELDRFLPFVDNWATCDMLRPKLFNRRRDELLPHTYRWISSGQTYTVRFAVEILMTHFLGEAFSPEFPEAVASINSDEYYINMMLAWYFAEALVKQHDCAIKYFENNRLPAWVHNAAIKKACESRRLSQEQKNELKQMKLSLSKL